MKELEVSTQRELSEQQHSFEREMKDLEEERKREKANKARIQEVLRACNRKAVLTRMHAQMNTDAMFKGITDCREDLQQISILVEPENQQRRVSNIINNLDYIERRKKNFDLSSEKVKEEIDKAKGSIVRLLMEISDTAGAPYVLPRHPTDEVFWTAEEAAKLSEGPERPLPSSL